MRSASEHRRSWSRGAASETLGLDALKDKSALVRIAAPPLRQAASATGNRMKAIPRRLGVHCGPGYRLYFARRGRVIVVMLNAGDKSTQKRNIRRALKLAFELGDDL